MVNQEEEYQFQDLGSTDVEDVATTEDVQNTIAKTDKMKKRIFLIAGTIVGIIILYNIFDLILNPAKKKTAKTEEVQKTTELSKRTNKNIVMDQDAKKEKDFDESFSLGLDQKDKGVGYIDEDRFDETQEELSDLVEMIEEIKNSINDLDSRLVDLSYSQTNLKKDLNQQKIAIKAIKIQKKPPIGSKRKVIKKEQYYIKAIIHGRSWLKTEKGSTITIKQGDTLPGYGSVLGIDPDKGEVVMASGDIIQFNPMDR
jgi:hypothetical protein